jgi:general secretion pathway protein B
MSFILDALRRLEEKREPETAGEIIAVARGGPGPSRRKPLWPWFLIVALSANVILVSGWFFIKGEGGKGRPVNPPAEQASPPAIKIEKAAGLSPTPAAETPPPPPQPVQERPPPATSSLRPPAATGEDPDLLPRFPAEGEGSAVETDEGPADSGEEDEAVPEEMTASRVTSFAELPEALRKSFKDLKIVAHVYSDDPAFRLLSIGEGLRREGEIVRPGLLLEEISPDGATFGFGGHHFRINAY